MVLAFFSADMFEAIEPFWVHLPKECDTATTRVDALVKNLSNVTPSFTIRHDDTLALTFFNGLVGAENLFMEAVYQTEKFPCLFAGGTVGGLLDFKNT